MAAQFAIPPFPNPIQQVFLDGLLAKAPLQPFFDKLGLHEFGQPLDPETAFVVVFDDQPGLNIAFLAYNLGCTASHFVAEENWHKLRLSVLMPQATWDDPLGKRGLIGYKTVTQSQPPIQEP